MARQVRRIEWANEEQERFFKHGPGPLLALGGFNAAKTWGAILKLLRLLDLFKNSRAAVVRSSSKDLRRTTMETFYALCPPQAYSRGRRNDLDGLLILNNGSRVNFMHLDKADSLNVLAGLELNFGFVDQAEQTPEAAWDTLDARLARWGEAVIPDELLAKYDPWPWTNEAEQPVPPPFLFATANPPESEDHFLFKRFAEGSEDYAKYKAEGYHYIKFDTRKNKFASKANLRKLLNKGEEFASRYVEGNWPKPTGTIFNVSNLSILEPDPALVNRVIQHMNLHRSMDHGETNPTCVLWEGTDHDENIFVYREYYEPNRIVSDHRESVFELSKSDIPLASVYNTPRYRSDIADPSIFALSRGRSATSGPTWAIADEWSDTTLMPKETAVYWRPAPIPRSEGTYELVTRNRLKEYLKVDPLHRHPLTGLLGAPRIYFIKKTDDYPYGCFHVLKELKGQRRVKIGEREGKPIFGEERSEEVSDHAYDTIKYHVISRPGPTRQQKIVDPNDINIKELMNWTARRQRARVASQGQVGGY
jgi:hypothetical protein